MKITFTEQFVNETEKKLGITRSDVRLIVEHPEKRETVSVSDDWQMEFFLGSVRDKSANEKLLIYGSLSDDDFKIFRAFKIYPDLINNIESKRILELLDTLANRFGWPVRLGDVEQKFFFFHQIVLHKDSDAVRIQPTGEYEFRVFKLRGKKGREYTMELLERHRLKLPYIEIDYALVFCIDLFEYRLWVKSHKAQTAQ